MDDLGREDDSLSPNYEGYLWEQDFDSIKSCYVGKQHTFAVQKIHDTVPNPNHRFIRYFCVHCLQTIDRSLTSPRKR